MAESGKKSFLFLFFSFLALCCFAQQSHSSKTVFLSAGIYAIKAEVAETQAQRELGLMNRSQLDLNQGMIFVFDEPAQVCMWMKNTLLPLSVAFLDENGKITNIEDMQPQSLTSHCAKRKIRYALEMNQGWFKQKNIQAGVLISGLPNK